MEIHRHSIIGFLSNWADRLNAAASPQSGAVWRRLPGFSLATSEVCCHWNSILHNSTEFKRKGEIGQDVLSDKYFRSVKSEEKKWGIRKKTSTL